MRTNKSRTRNTEGLRFIAFCSLYCLFLFAGCSNPANHEPSAAPAAPAAPTVTAGNGRLEVSWTAVTDATAYEVWHGASDNIADARQFGSDVSGVTTTITGFGKYIKHHVWIKAKNSAGASGFSPPASGIPLGLDPRLVGVWQFVFGGQVLEQCAITANTTTVDGVQSLGTLDFGGFAGDILWAEAFDDEDVLRQHMYFRPASGRWDVTNAGVIIIKYWPGHGHSMWAPAGNYFGLYYMNLNDDGTRAAIFHTSDQANNYGPTETASLEAAKERFTIDNIKLWLSTEAGDPHTKVTPVEQVYGSVTVSFADGAARTIFPNTVFASCVYTFYNQSNGQSQVKTPDSDGSFALTPGSWSVEVQAYGDPEAADALAATGVSNAFTVTAGGNTAVTVSLIGIPETGTGTFKYRIRYPAGATVWDFTIVKLPDMIPVSFSIPARGGSEMSGTINNVPAGFYLVSLRLLHPDGEKGAGKNQVVHIYNALTSEFGSEGDPVVFADGDFAFLPLPAPSALTVTMAGAGQLNVSWMPVMGAAAYELWYGALPDLGGAQKWDADVTDTSASITGLSNPTYYVWVRARNDLGPGDFSPAARGLFVKSIATAADMAKIGVDAAWPLNGNYALDADITLENWIPIGAGSAFSGSFDGDDRTITIKSFDADFVNANSNLGVFANIGGSAAEKARIENLTVHSELNYTLSGSYSVGILTGQALQYSLCSNITVTGSLAFSASGLVSAGGIAGVLNGGEATGCAINASLTVSGAGAGGSYSYVGGVAGRYQGGASITECHSAGNVSGSTTGANILAGGIAGGTLHSWSGGDTAAYYGKIENCSSSGVIGASGGFYWSIAGGIVGHLNGDGTKTPGAGRTRVVNCYATGTVQAEGPAGSWPYLGGIVGQNQTGGVSRCYFTGTVRALGDSINDYTGGIAGHNSGGIVEDCWSSGSINGRINGGGIVGQNIGTGVSLRRCYSTAAITLRGLAGERGSAAGHGAGGIAGYNHAETSNCVALNPSITSAGFELIHRVAGAVTGNPNYTGAPGVQINNLAWDGMVITVNDAVIIPDDVGPNGMDGQGATIQKPGQAVYAALGWDFVNIWKMGGDGYPVLQ